MYYCTKVHMLLIVFQATLRRLLSYIDLHSRQHLTYMYIPSVFKRTVEGSIVEKLHISTVGG